MNNEYQKYLEEFKHLVAIGKLPDKPWFYKRTEEEKIFNTVETKSLMNHLKSQYKLESYLIYGTLLGAIREKDFILHDYDVDIAYLSKYNNKADVLKEFNDLIYQFGELLSKVCSPGHIHMYSPGKKFKIDVWTSWIENNTIYLIPLLNGNINESVLCPIKKTMFRGVEFDVPNKPEEMCDILYSNWKTPLYDKWRKEFHKRNIWDNK